MKISWWGNRSVDWYLGLALAFVAGLGLRCYLLADQVFLDDEWHGFYFALGKSPGWLLTHFSVPGATCLPLNFYIWLLGQTTGWSETLLRLPSLLCGSLLLLCPLLLQRLVGTRRTLLLAFLLAISPVLIFYSRLCRPYSAVAFLGFAAVLLAARWWQTGERKWGVWFVLAGVLAIYFHLFAIVTVAAPFLAAFTVFVWRRFAGNRPDDVPPTSFGKWLVAGAATAAVSALLVLPALIHSMHDTFFYVALHGSFSAAGFAEMASLFSGTSLVPLVAVFWLAAIGGAVEQCRRNPWLGWTLVSLFPLHLLALLLSRPDGAQSTIVLTRYCIPLVPVCLFFAACGIQWAWDAIAARITFPPWLQTGTAAMLVAWLLLAGPLPQTYAAPNNFTNHSAFQRHYGDIEWRWSFFSDLIPPAIRPGAVLMVDEVSPFYQTLGQEVGHRPIVEYPMVIGDHFNTLYYYQHFHHRPVLVGYAAGVSLPRGLAAGYVFGNTYVDEVLSLAPDPSRLHFRNFIDMDDLSRMRERQVEYVVLHKRFESQLPQLMLPLPELGRLYKKYSQALGPPVFEDEHIAVFRW